MAIELTDKITPKNAAFADIVDAKSVGGDGTSANALPADTVASGAANDIVRVDSTGTYLEGTNDITGLRLKNYTRNNITSAITQGATNNNVATSGYTYLYLNKPVGAPTTITGFVAGADGDLLILSWQSLSVLSLLHSSVSSTLGNRLNTHTATTVTSSGQGAWFFVYDTGALGGQGGWTMLTSAL